MDADPLTAVEEPAYVETLEYSTQMTPPGAADSEATEEIAAESRSITGINLDGAFSIDWDDCYRTSTNIICSVTRQVASSMFETLQANAANMGQYTYYWGYPNGEDLIEDEFGGPLTLTCDSEQGSCSAPPV